MSYSSRLCTALAITAATLAQAQDRFDFAAFINLESEIVDPFDLQHEEPEVDDFNREHHALDNEMEEDNELQWEIMQNISGNLKCKAGYTKVGCCKCVHDDHIAAKPSKLVVPDMKAAALKYHGMGGADVKNPTATAASPPNVLGWFSGSDDDDDKKKEKEKEKGKEREQDDDDERKDRRGRDDDEEDTRE